MAKIEVQPGETFEHSHPTASTTTLVSGSAELTVDGETIPLVRNVPVAIPAGEVHTIRNVGPTSVVVKCGYTP